jgi:streptomycin 6-kinase
MHGGSPESGIIAINGNTLEIPSAVRLKALSMGQAGEAWLAGLAGVVSDLTAEWGLSVDSVLRGGTEAFVAGVAMPDGRKAVLKVSIPTGAANAGELDTLLAGHGRAYAAVYACDKAREAILLERLGRQLYELGWPVDAQIAAICATLRAAWMPLPQGVHFMTGAEKAKSLSAFIEAAWQELGRPCAERTIETALDYAEIRRRGFDPALAVLAHGDAHAWNTLLIPGDGPARFKFVDPDGLFIERAYDLGISMREWTSELLAGDPLALGRKRCLLLAELAGVDPEPIWQWGFLERVSTGLLCMKVGLDGGRDMLAVADAWAAPSGHPRPWQ